MQFSTLIAAIALGFAASSVASPTNHNPATHHTPMKPTGKCKVAGGQGHGICEVYDGNPSLSTSRVVQRPPCGPEHPCRSANAHCHFQGGYAVCS